MDIYGEDNVISSDEYDESDDLLNVAVSSANIKQEPQKPTVNPTQTSPNSKPQQKFIRALGMKLKKKSVKWMQHKFKRNQIRHRYLYNIARAKCINKPSNVNSMRGNSAGLVKQLELVDPKKAFAAEANRPMNSAAKVSQHETIDLDDSDDDDAEDYDESSTSDSSNDEDDDIDEINNEDDDDLDETNNDNEKHEDEDVNEIEVKDDIVAINNQILEAIIQNQVVEGPTKKIMPIDEVPKSENVPENDVEMFHLAPPAHHTPNPKIFNSTVQEQVSQKEVEAIAIISPEAINMPPTDAEIVNSMECHEAPRTITSQGALEAPRTITSLEGRDDTPCNMVKTNNNCATAIKNDVEIMNISKDLGVEQSFFFNDELNAMYPNFDKIVNEHVTFPETAEIIKERIKIIAADVEHINKALEIKEKECNQLLYVKHTKEQILARLLRKIKRNEVNTDQSVIDAIVSRELGLVPKQTRPKEPPSKRRKLEPRTAQEILQQGANMSMDEVLRAKAQSNLDENFIDDTLKKFGLSSYKPAAKSKQSSNKPNHANSELFDTSINTTTPDTRLPNFANRMDQQQTVSSERGQNLLLNLLNNDNDSDDASISSNVRNTEQESALENLLDSWVAHRQLQRVRNSHNKADDDNYEVIIEKKAPTKTTNLFPILNQSKTTLPNSGETLVVHLNESDFKDSTSTQKFRGNIANNFICQHCGIHKAQYVCAECENQWYCSRSCQVKAWDSHCETCE